MIILSDCLTEKIDEGCIKVANSLAKKIKEQYPETTIVSYNRKPKQSDFHFQLNKLFINWSLFSLIRSKKEAVIYIPFASNTKASVIRIFVLSVIAKNGLSVVFVMRLPMSWITKKIMKISGAEIIALSRESYDFYTAEIGKAKYLKTGVCVNQFVPVNAEKKEALRNKYGVVPNKKVLLHVGHLKKGRNIDKLLNVGDDYHVFLVVSSVTEKERDEYLRVNLNARPNTTIIDSYLEKVEEIYQMADVYLFPVQESMNCIDIPLSVLEAAACNIPIITTDYGEIKEFINEPGFCFLDELDGFSLEQAINKVASIKNCNNRNAVMDYDWEVSIRDILS